MCGYGYRCLPPPSKSFGDDTDAKTDRKPASCSGHDLRPFIALYQENAPQTIDKATQISLSPTDRGISRSIFFEGLYFLCPFATR